MKKWMLAAVLIIAALVTSAAYAQSTTPNQEAFLADLTKYVSGVMADIGNAASDPLAAAIASSGASGLTINSKDDPVSLKSVKASFYIKGLDPKSGALPKYGQDPFAYWQKLSEAINGYTYKVTLTVQSENGTFTLADKQRLALESAISKAAAKAQTDIGDKSLITPLTDLIAPIPVPLKGSVKTIEEDNYSDLFVSFADHHPADYSRLELACAFLMIKNGAVSYNDDGTMLNVAYQYPADLEDFMAQAVAPVMKDLKRDPQAKNYSEDELRKKLLSKLGPLALNYRKDKNAASQTYSFTLPLDSAYNLDTWYEPSESYLDDFVYNLDDTVLQMQDQIGLLPDYPAMDEPKTGRLSGSTSGTKVILRIPKDGYARYVEFRDSSDWKAVSCYIRASSSSVSVRLPEGDYYLLIGVGDTWYGPDHLFGENGSYSKTDYTQVPSSSWIYTLTLQPRTDIEDGVPIYDVNLDDLLNN